MSIDHSIQPFSSICFLENYLKSIAMLEVNMKYALMSVLVMGSLASATWADALPTRFGQLQVNDENQLLFNGKPLKPEVQGNNGLSLLEKYTIDDKDVVLVQDNGGTACPATYYFATVSKARVSATPGFGTCSDLIKVKQDGVVLTVSMPGYKGEFESKASQKKAGKEKHLFVYKDGRVTENGKPVK
ncbi:hypothetical protein [Chromobacterium sp. IIBBL 290-4]|uniref:hypothetical protein n=1 Tax=Chromobacterium sp. IIBBL 290-4 TaxID=2953890 RepID=UPI0020B82D8C|nr:hypothetical protein [Chromobacterium sp. IIBBL 290-4]UTH75184.1 hypothetical protein NKT35_03540 [Chromobacterium sp. IIBBL 290-4]